MEGFIGNTIDNPKNETCKALESWFGVNTSLKDNEKVKDVEVGEEKEVNENMSDYSERGVIIDHIIDKSSPLRRTKKQILNVPNPELPYYIKGWRQSMAI